MALREVLARFDIDMNTGPLGQASGLVAGLTSNLAALGGLLAGAAIVRGAQQFVSEMIDVGDELHKAGIQVGLSAEKLQAWRFAADRSGVSGGALTNSLMRLQRSAFEAGNGMATYTESFDALGIEVKDNEGNLKDANTLMLDLARGLGGLESQTEKVAIAQRLMGRTGAKLLPLFEDGEEGAQALLDRFEELGGGFSEAFVENAAAAQDALTDFDLAMDGIKSTIAVALLPGLTRFITSVAEIGAVLSDAAKNSHILETAMGVLGLVAVATAIKTLVAFGPIIALFLFIAAAVGAVILLIDDFIVFLEGGESVIGEFFDEIGIGNDNAREGILGVAEEFRKFFAAIPGFADFFVEIWGGVFESIGELFDKMVADITAFFTQDFGEMVSSAFGAVGDLLTGNTEGGRATLSAPGGAGAAAGGGNVDNRTAVNVTVDGARDPAATAQAVGVEVNRRLGEQNRRAAVALEQAAT